MQKVYYIYEVNKMSSIGRPKGNNKEYVYSLRMDEHIKKG